MARLPSGAVPLLDLTEHFIESIDQLAQLAVGILVSANCVIAHHGDSLGGLYEVDHGIRDEALQPVTHDECHEPRNNHD